MPETTPVKPVSKILAEGYAAVAAGRPWTAEHEAAKKLADAAPEMLDCLNDNVRKWRDEEDSVQEEHAELIERTEALTDKLAG